MMAAGRRGGVVRAANYFLWPSHTQQPGGTGGYLRHLPKHLLYSGVNPSPFQQSSLVLIPTRHSFIAGRAVYNYYNIKHIYVLRPAPVMSRRVWRDQSWGHGTV